jgi:hypothetical protein
MPTGKDPIPFTVMILSIGKLPKINYAQRTRGPERVSVSPATESYWPRELNGSLWFIWPPPVLIIKTARR